MMESIVMARRVSVINILLFSFVLISDAEYGRTHLYCEVQILSTGFCKFHL
jgi:hypothetical protein